MKWIKTKDRLPNDNQYVLAHLTITNWGKDEGQYHKVVKFKKGISKEGRNRLSPSDIRKKTYRSFDEWANNKEAYGWDEFGPGFQFGQDVDKWCEL